MSQLLSFLDTVLWGMSAQLSFSSLGCEFLFCGLLGRKLSWLVGSEGFPVEGHSDLSVPPVGVSHCSTLVVRVCHWSDEGIHVILFREVHTF